MEDWRPPPDPNAPFREGVVRATVPDDIRGRGQEGQGPLKSRGGWAGPAGQSPGPGGPFVGPTTGPQTGQGSAIAFPPDVFPTLGAIDFFQRGSSTALTAANTPVVLTVATAPGAFIGNGLVFQVPGMHIAVVRDINISVNAMVASTDITWRLLQDGALVPGWELAISPRIAGSIETAFTADSTLIRIRESARIELEINVRDGGTYQAAGTFHGWAWPRGT